MIVSNMVSSKGNYVPNQFITYEYGNGSNGNFIKREHFQSYKNMICQITTLNNGKEVILDSYYWNYSRTTSKYLSMFLGESTMDIKKKIKNGTYTLANLN